MPLATERRIAIVYEPESIPLLKLAAMAGRGVFDPVWVTDDVDVDVLRRLGAVVEIAGQSIATVADQLERMGVVGITTFADAQIERTAAIARRMGLPAHSAETARCLVDKIAQRRALADAGVPGPAFVGVRTREGLAEQSALLGELRYPVVVKPAVGFGGRDIVYLLDSQSLRSCLEMRCASALFEATIVEECLGLRPALGEGRLW